MASTFNLSATAEDAAGQHQTFNVHVPRGALTLATITTFWQDFMLLADVLMDAKIISGQVTVDIPPAGVKANAVANSRVHRGANFLFNCDQTPYKYGVRLPGFTPSFFSGLNVVTNADTTAFETALTAGILTGGVQVNPSNQDGLDVLSLSSKRESNRK